MPAVGDQHKPNGHNTANPFDDPKQRITEYTAQEIATLQSRLDKQLGPEYISARAGPGGAKVHYLAADKAISLANEVFGFNGWSSSIQNIQIDFVDENPQTGKISLGLSVIVRVSLKDGTHHEDIGYGQIENCKGKAAAFEKAKKEGTTDGLKRALRNFGNVLGNCVYDKSYLAKVTKLKVGATKWDPNMLHRHPDFAPTKREEAVKPSLPTPAQDVSPEFDDTFDLADFEVDDFDGVDMTGPDEVATLAEAPDTTRGSGSSASERMPPPSKTDFTTPSKPPAPLPRPAATRPAQSSALGNVVPQPLPGQRPQAILAQSGRPSPAQDQPRAVLEESTRVASPNFSAPQPLHHPHAQASPTAGGIPRTAGFYSAKAAAVIDANNNVTVADSSAAPKFNPHAESPSIRKTSGVNHSKSVPLKRDLTPDTSVVATNVINPQSEPGRRVGAPGPNGSFVSARGPGPSAYRPPTRRGPEPNPAASVSVGPADPGGVDRALSAARRTPLGDVSNMQQHSATAMTADGVDAKRQRILNPGQDGVGSTETLPNNPSNG